MTNSEAVIIFYGGYATHKKETVDDWFKARRIVRDDPKCVPKIVKPKRKSSGGRRK